MMTLEYFFERPKPDLLRKYSVILRNTFIFDETQMRDRISSQSLIGVAQLIESYGQDASPIAKRVGLNPEALYRTDLLISQLKINEMLEESALVCDDPFFSLKLAPSRGFHMLGPIWLLIRAAQTVREALDILTKNLERHTSGLSAYLTHQDSGASLNLEVRMPNVVSKQRRGLHSEVSQITNLDLAVCCYELRKILGNHWRPQHVQFRYAAPEVMAPLHQVFGENLYFNQDVNAIQLSDDDLRHPFNTEFMEPQITEREIEASLGHGIPFTQRVDRVIRRLINGESCTVNQVADALNISLRTLQNRLKKNQTCYQSLYDNARLSLAEHYMRKSELSITAVSERLHFKDATAFTHFFKGKVGCSPREYRKRSLH